MASLVMTYFLWLVGGVFGLHHLYLGRVNQAIVWFATLGGGLGLGCLRDLWRIPYYVRWRNGEKECQKEHLSRMALNRRASSGVIRIMGMFVMGYLTCVFFAGLLPTRKKNAEAEISLMSSFLYRLCSSLLILAGSSIGVYVVGNIGEMKCSFFYPMIGSLVGTPWLVISETNASVPTLLSVMATWWFGLEWRSVGSTASSRSGIENVLLFLVGISLWSSVLYCGIYYNAEITVKSGERIPLRIVMRNFFASPAWGRMKDSFYRIAVAFWNDGWRSALWDATVVFDFSGEANALRVLDLNKSASQEMITKQCRKLSSKFHPDRQVTETGKIEAEKEFLKIREACNILVRKPYQRTRYS